MIRKSISATGLVLALWLGGAGDAGAQRTSDGSLFIGAAQMVSVYAFPSGGIDIGAGGYLRHSFWRAGMKAVDWNHRVSSDTGVEHGDLFDHISWSLYGGYRFRLAGTYSRVFSIYAGGDIFMGLNQYEVFRILPDELSTGLPGVEFIYGVAPEIELECFVSRSVALALGVQLPVTLGSSIRSDTWNLTGSVGVRINIFRR